MPDGASWAIRLARRLAVPAALAFFQVAGSLGAAGDQPDRRPVDALAVVLLLAGPAAIALLRRRVVAMAAVVIAATLAYVAAGYPYGPVFTGVVVALFLVVRDGQRVTAWVMAGVGLVAGALLAPLGGTGPGPGWIHGAAAAGWLVVVLVVAEAVRDHAERTAAARRALEERALRQASDERLRIARELHDVLAHNISLISVQAGMGLHLVDEQPERAREALTAIRRASSEALGELRGVLDVLRGDGTVAPRAPVAGLDQLDRVVGGARAAGLRVDIETLGTARPLPPEVDLAALRIAQEALTNVARHARAGAARIELAYEPAALVVTVDDDGRGAGPGGVPTDGNGIAGMRERATALGGQLHAGPGPSGGFRVSARLPTGTRP